MESDRNTCEALRNASKISKSVVEAMALKGWGCVLIDDQREGMYFSWTGV